MIALISAAGNYAYGGGGDERKPVNHLHPEESTQLNKERPIAPAVTTLDPKIGMMSVKEYLPAGATVYFRKSIKLYPGSAISGYISEKHEDENHSGSVVSCEFYRTGSKEIRTITPTTAFKVISIGFRYLDRCLTVIELESELTKERITFQCGALSFEKKHPSEMFPIEKQYPPTRVPKKTKKRCPLVMDINPILVLPLVKEKPY